MKENIEGYRKGKRKRETKKKKDLKEAKDPKAETNPWMNISSSADSNYKIWPFDHVSLQRVFEKVSTKYTFLI